MKKTRNEKLLNYISDIDDELLERALSIDDAQKLQEYTKNQNSQKKSSLFPLKFRYTAVIAAGLAIIIGATLILQPLFQPLKGGNSNGPDYSEAIPPWQREDDELFQIESIDMLNYYSGMKLLADTERTAANTPKCYTSLPVLSIAANTSILRTTMPFTASTYHNTFSDSSTKAKTGIGYDTPQEDFNTENGIGYDTPPENFNTEGNIGYDTPPDDFQPESSKPDNQLIYYYELDPNEVFTIYQVIYFQTELTDENGFLASKIGTGIIDVVITDNNLEPMITFKNGDKYYSCCINGSGPQYEEYSTHKYIEGFYLVKNMEQDNYSFTVTYSTSPFDKETKTVTSLVCNSYKNGGPNADGELPIMSKTHVLTESADFTIADLEAYFNANHAPNDTEIETPSAELAAIYSNGIYQFETYSDGSFIYRSTVENNLAYRKGTYHMLCDQIIFSFISNDDQVETVECELLGPKEGDGFYYHGIHYKLLVP